MRERPESVRLIHSWAAADAAFRPATSTGMHQVTTPDRRRTVVGIGASIFLIAVGAILAFAVNVDLGDLDINVVGWILMIAGVLGLVMTTLIWGRRRTVVPPAPVEEPPVVTQAPVEERRV